MSADGEEPQRTSRAAPVSRVATGPMTVPDDALSSSDDALRQQALAEELLNLASSDDFTRWEQQLAGTGNCANPVRLYGRIDVIDRVTGEIASIYDTTNEPGGVLRIPCGNCRRRGLST